MRYREPEKRGIARAKGSSARRGRPQGIKGNIIYIDQKIVSNRTIKVKSDDTIERENIHTEIKRLLEYGLDKKETLERLTEKFKNSKYVGYFELWIEDQFKKLQKRKEKEVKKDGQDR